ncbi:FadR family transcriptional regulator [Pyramidobacter sp. SM-530-WT-4B]|uniref:FadR family transcriptional regulator n=1 Tax=Pyramidobacter porci TaxID=2605789 RepID=A0A6L5YDQ2_9BACT|nr:FCD domain-containing protein [Pyramidobacter porci]MDY2647860.1 FCD domain-containing protein [Pyramidobacter porci]MST56391.1 FadR family transcriptional regulator [Pyramidobacter porci]
MQNKRSQVVDSIIGEIRRRNLRKGDRLPSERELASITGVSRNLLREALAVLETQNVLQTRERGGIQLVRDPGMLDFSLNLQEMILWPDQSLNQLMEIRRIAEIPAARLAAKRRTDDDIAHLRRCVEELRLIEKSGENRPNDGAQWDALYHSAMVKAAGNDILTRIYESIHALLLKYIGSNRARFYREARPDMSKRALKEHIGLLNAIENQEPDEAARIMGEHLDLFESWIIPTEHRENADTSS